MTSPLIGKAEANTSWKTWMTKTDVDIDKEWTIKFNEEIDYKSLWENVYIVRERDNKRIDNFHPDVDWNDKKSATLYLYELYEFGETYDLYIENAQSINGTSLKTPIKMKFQTVNPEFSFKNTVEQDGIKFEVALNTEELAAGEKLYVKVKATNTSADVIPYWGRDGCDIGLSANIFIENESGKAEEGSKWNSIRPCTAMPEGYFLEPGETIEVTEVLYPAAERLNENAYLKVLFQQGPIGEISSFNSIKIPIKNLQYGIIMKMEKESYSLSSDQGFTVNVENKGLSSYSFDKEFELERKSEDKWIKIPYTIAFPGDMGESRPNDSYKNVALFEYFGKPITVGEYRFVQKFWNDDQSKDPVELAAYFTVTE